MARAQDRNLKAGIDTEAIDTDTEEECCLLASSPWLVHLAFLRHTEPQARDGTIQSDLGLPTSIINQENVP